MEELELGQRLALKGQLFELQKRLKIIDIEQQQKEEFTFQPESYTASYPLQDREPTYTKNVERAEIMRKQRLDMLKATMDAEQAISHTFSPELSRKSKKLQKRTDSTAFDRLYESANTIRENKKALANKVTDYDAMTGQKLYHPKITVKSKKMLGASETDTNAHEYMYRDALDREERIRQLTRKSNAELEKTASSSKLNKKSKVLLRQRQERETRALYDALDIQTVGELSYDDILRGSEIIASKGKQLPQLIYKTTQQVWDFCEGDRLGYVTFELFAKKASPVVQRKAQSATLPTPSQMERSLKGGGGSSLGSGGASDGASPRRPGSSWTSTTGRGRENDGDGGGVRLGEDDGDDEEDVTTSAQIETDADVFKMFINSLLEILHASKEYAKTVDISRTKQRKYLEHIKAKNAKGSGTFAPSIGATSRRLALSKEERDAATLIYGGSPNASPMAPPPSSATETRSPAQTKQGLQLLWARTEELEQRKEAKRRAHLDKEMQECTFQPRIHTQSTPGGIRSAPGTPGTPGTPSSRRSGRGMGPSPSPSRSAASYRSSSPHLSSSAKASKESAVITRTAHKVHYPHDHSLEQAHYQQDDHSYASSTTGARATKSHPELGHGGLKSSASSITTIAGTVSTHGTFAADTDDTPRTFADLSAANLGLRDGLDAAAQAQAQALGRGGQEHDPHGDSSSVATSNPHFVAHNHSVLQSVPSNRSDDGLDDGGYSSSSANQSPSQGQGVGQEEKRGGEENGDNGDDGDGGGSDDDPMREVDEDEAVAEEKSEKFERRSLRSSSAASSTSRGVAPGSLPVVPEADADDHSGGGSGGPQASYLPPRPPQPQDLEETSSVYSDDVRSEGSSVVEYEYFDEHGNRIDPADIQEHHIVVDEEEADPDAAEYTDAERAGINAQKDYIRQLHALPVSERLYAQRNLHKPPRVKYRGQKSDEVELDGCTFRPTVAPYEKPAHAASTASNVPAAQNPTGWDESIARMRASAEKRRAILTRDEDEYVGRELAYIKSRQQALKGHIPLRFHSDSRIAYYKEKHERGPVKPRLYIDVRLSKTKTVNMALHDGDDPKVMAARFCKIYGLGLESRKVLEEVVRQSMEVNGVEAMESKMEKERKEAEEAAAAAAAAHEAATAKATSGSGGEGEEEKEPRQRKRKDHQHHPHPRSHRHHKHHHHHHQHHHLARRDSMASQVSAIDDDDSEGREDKPQGEGDGGDGPSGHREEHGEDWRSAGEGHGPGSSSDDEEKSYSSYSSYASESDSDSSVDNTPLYTTSKKR